MSNKRHRLVQWTSLLAGSFIALQIAFILVRGEAFCLNDGCRVVEKLTTIPPLYINLAGLIYFIALFSVSRWPKIGSAPSFDHPRLLLLLGLAVEGVLLGYQIFVTQTFCSYCLIVLIIIIGLNIIYGWQQIRIGIPLFIAMIAAFAVLNFSPASLLALRSESLDSGTYAVRNCAAPAKKLYFFFSSGCPHCKKVLSVLENCNNCEFHFNPIDTNQTLGLPELEYTRSYSASLNRVILSMLNITTIPVLLVQNPDGLTFIKGEEAITRYISKFCFLQDTGPSVMPSLEDDPERNLNLFDEQQGMNLIDGQEGECAIEVECPEETEQFQGLFNR